MSHLHLEFMVGPFDEGRPGRHVRAAVDAAAAAGLEVEMGPFASVAEGDIDAVAEALARMVRAAFAHGGDRLSVHVAPGRQGGAGLAPLDLTGALARMLAELEVELGLPLAELDRQAKQVAVRTLEERGAFTLRRAIEDVADALGVSRVTVYNYLDSIR